MGGGAGIYRVGGSRDAENMRISAVDNAKLTEMRHSWKEGSGEQEGEDHVLGLLGQSKRDTGQRDTSIGNAGSVVKSHFSCHLSQQMPAFGPRPRLWGRAGMLHSPGWSCCRCTSSPSSHR